MISLKASFNLGKVVYWYFTQVNAWREFFREAPTANDVAIRFAKHELRDGDVRLEVIVQSRPGKIEPVLSMDTVQLNEIDAYIAAIKKFLMDNHQGDIPFVEVEIARDEWR